MDINETVVLVFLFKMQTPTLKRMTTVTVKEEDNVHNIMI